MGIFFILCGSFCYLYGILHISHIREYSGYSYFSYFSWAFPLFAFGASLLIIGFVFGKSKHFASFIIIITIVFSNLVILVSILLPMPWIRVVWVYDGYLENYDYHPLKEGLHWIFWSWGEMGNDRKIPSLLSVWLQASKKNIGLAIVSDFLIHAPVPFWIVTLTACLVWFHFKKRSGILGVTTIIMVFSIFYGLSWLPVLNKTYLLDDVGFVQFLMGPPPRDSYILLLSPFYIALIGCICSVSLPILFGLKLALDRTRAQKKIEEVLANCGLLPNRSDIE